MIINLKKYTFCLFVMLNFFTFISYAETSTNTVTTQGSNTSESTNEIQESRNCCYSTGISYCDATAGHYVCKDGSYSACLCTNQAPVSTYRQLALGCCLWHGGVVASSLGQVVCADGSLSPVCSLQNEPSVSGMGTSY